MEDSNIFEQTGIAVNFLDHLSGVELGYDEIKGRELTMMEQEVKESALTLLLEYFVADYGKKLKPRVHKSKSRRKKTKKKVVENENPNN